MSRAPTVLIVVLVTAALVTGCASRTASRWTFAPVAVAVGGPSAQPAETGAPAASPATATPAGPTAAPPSGTPDARLASSGTLTRAATLEIHAYDIGYDPRELTVPAPGTYTVRFVNDGTVGHDLTFDDGTVIKADAGQTVEGDVVVPDGGMGFLCSVPGHAPAGMTGTITVAAAGGSGSTHAGTSQAVASAAPSPAASHGAVADHGGPAPMTDVAADPNAPPPVVRDPHAPPLLDGDVHDITLVITEQLMTVAPGYVQQVWTFGGQVPGPVIRVKVGDTVRVHLVNSPANQLSHSIDFHASQVAWNDEMRSIAPGEELVYEWRADYAGVWMYHCGTAPTLHHIANGMYGMVIVEPSEGLPPVDQEFALVQSEWYLGQQGQPSSLEKAMAPAPAPDFVVFNGLANQYKDSPLEVGTGDRVRFFVLDAGPSVDSSFHVVGTIFDTVIKEGVHLVKGNDGNWGSQAVDLAPAQGAIVELTTAEDGLYPMVTHAFNMVGRGALGLLKAGDGDPTN